MSTNDKIRSGRRYPPANCKNESCKEEFIPHDKRQLYCNIHCKTNSNNDKRLNNDDTRFVILDTLRNNIELLHELFMSGKCEYSFKELDDLGFDFHHCLDIYTDEYGMTIYNYCRYGLKTNKERLQFFEIVVLDMYRNPAFRKD